EFMEYQSTFQVIFKKNEGLRSSILQMVLNKGWNYSKHIPWNWTDVIRSTTGGKRTYTLKITHQSNTPSFHSSSSTMVSNVEITSTENTATEKSNTEAHQFRISEPIKKTSPSN